MTSSCSSADSCEPLGKQRPRSKRSAETAPPRTRHSSKHRLQVHGLPHRPRLDVLRGERQPQFVARGAEGRSVDGQAREPARASARTTPPA